MPHPYREAPNQLTLNYRVVSMLKRYADRLGHTHPNPYQTAPYYFELKAKQECLDLIEDFRKAYQILSPYDLGYAHGYNDEMPNCPFEEGTQDHLDYHKGYEQGSMDC